MELQEIEARLGFALRASEEVAAVILRYYQESGVNVERKGDATPVTDADRKAEELLRKAIEKNFPDDGVFGEEFGEQEGQSGGRWVLDPIDGTKAFVTGVPLFGTLVGFQWQGEPVVGVCRFPALQEVVFAGKGYGTWWIPQGKKPRRVWVSPVDRLEQATVCYTELSGWEQTRRTQQLLALCSKAELVRGWGDCFGHMLVATGRAEVMLDPLLNEWDAAALIPIIQEAGGHFLDWQGQPTNGNGCGISVSDKLKDQLFQVLNSF